jgi:hypothetical protein
VTGGQRAAVPDPKDSLAPVQRGIGSGVAPLVTRLRPGSSRPGRGKGRPPARPAAGRQGAAIRTGSRDQRSRRPEPGRRPPRLLQPGQCHPVRSQPCRAQASSREPLEAERAGAGHPSPKTNGLDVPATRFQCFALRERLGGATYAEAGVRLGAGVRRAVFSCARELIPSLR